MRAEAVPDAHARGYWNVWQPHDEARRYGTKLAGPMRHDEALAYARGWNDAMKSQREDAHEGENRVK